MRCSHLLPAEVDVHLRARKTQFFTSATGADTPAKTIAQLLNEGVTKIMVYGPTIRQTQDSIYDLQSAMLAAGIMSKITHYGPVITIDNQYEAWAQITIATPRTVDRMVRGREIEAFIYTWFPEK